MNFWQLRKSSYEDTTFSMAKKQHWKTLIIFNPTFQIELCTFKHWHPLILGHFSKQPFHTWQFQLESSILDLPMWAECIVGCVGFLVFGNWRILLPVSWARSHLCWNELQIFTICPNSCDVPPLGFWGNAVFKSTYLILIIKISIFVLIRNKQKKGPRTFLSFFFQPLQLVELNLKKEKKL